MFWGKLLQRSFRLTGYLPVSDKKTEAFLSICISVFHIITLTILGTIPLINRDEGKKNTLAVYVAYYIYFRK